MNYRKQSEVKLIYMDQQVKFIVRRVDLQNVERQANKVAQQNIHAKNYNKLLITNKQHITPKCKLIMHDISVKYSHDIYFIKH